MIIKNINDFIFEQTSDSLIKLKEELTKINKEILEINSNIMEIKNKERNKLLSKSESYKQQANELRKKMDAYLKKSNVYVNIERLKNK